MLRKAVLALSVAIALSSLDWLPLIAHAEQAARIPVVGVLSNSSAGSYMYSLRDGLREMGYVEGQSIAFEWRWAGAHEEHLPELAAELVRTKVDVIVASNNAAITAAQKATKQVPIVMVIANEPVAVGFVTSLARPGGNTTGLTIQDPEQAGKRIQLLKEVIPDLSQLALLWDATLPGIQFSVSPAESAARSLGIRVQLHSVRSEGELKPAFATMTQEGAGAVRIFSSGMLYANRERIADLAVKHRLPTLCTFADHVRAGCLMSYSVSFAGQARRAAYFVDKILNGVKPADLPVEQPTKFELVINLKTAKALGLTIPQSLLLRADEVIQ
jgi:putative ABC transport system substrate-binding protein